MKKILGRILIVVPAIFLQITWSFFVLGLLNSLLNGHLGYILEIIFSILAIVFVTGLVSKRDESSYKLLWVMTIVSMPVLGSILYFLVGNKRTGKKLKNRLDQSSLMLKDMLSVGEKEYITDIKEQDLRIGQTLEHLSVLHSPYHQSLLVDTYLTKPRRNIERGARLCR